MITGNHVYYVSKHLNTSAHTVECTYKDYENKGAMIVDLAGHKWLNSSIICEERMRSNCTVSFAPAHRIARTPTSSTFPATCTWAGNPENRRRRPTSSNAEMLAATLTRWSLTTFCTTALPALCSTLPACATYHLSKSEIHAKPRSAVNECVQM